MELNIPNIPIHTATTEQTPHSSTGFTKLKEKCNSFVYFKDYKSYHFSENPVTTTTQ